MSLREVGCRELVELVTDYIEGALDLETIAAIEAHLDECPGCRAYLEQMRSTIAVLGTVSAEGLPDAAVADLLRAFRARR